MTAVVVEDESILRLYVCDLLKERGIEVLGEASAGEEALVVIRRTRPDVVLLDIKLKGDLDGSAVARQIAGDDGPRIVLMTAYALDDGGPELASPNIVGHLSKPISEIELDRLLAEVR